MAVILPDLGETNWGGKLNSAITGLSTTIDAHTALLASRPVAASDGDYYLGLTIPLWQAGPNCGLVFTAPASGQVYVTVSGYMESNTALESCYLSYEIKVGSTIGSGTVFFAAVTDYGVGIGGGAAGGSGSSAMGTRISGSRRKLITGLAPGVTYNARTMHGCTGGSFDIFRRELLVEPVK